MDRSAPGIRIVMLSSEKAPSGEPLNLDGRVLSLTYEDSEKKADKVTITLDNFDLSLFDRKDVVNGCVLEVSWGYPGNMAPPRRVVVQNLKGFQTLTLEGTATSVILGKKAKTRSWKSKRRSDVVQEVAQEWGYSGTTLEVDNTEIVYDVINQTNETDAAFLRRLATKENFAFFVDDSGLHWHERRSGASPSNVLEWYSDGTGKLISVDVESDLMRRVGKVSVKGRDPVNKTTIGKDGTSATTDRNTMGTVVEVVDPLTGQTSTEIRNASVVGHPTSATSEAEAKKEADARFKKAEAEALKLNISLVGDPQFRAKSVIELQGISTLLSGKYYVSECKHSVSSSGYTIEAKVTRDAVGRRTGLNGGGKAAGGQTQGGTPNRNQAATGGALTPIEVVDPVTGATSVEYRRAPGQTLGAGDPEAKK